MRIRKLRWHTTFHSVDKQQILASRAVKQAAFARTVFKQKTPATKTNPELEGEKKRENWGYVMLTGKVSFSPSSQQAEGSFAF